MRKLVASMAFALAVLYGGAAKAAGVDVSVDKNTGALTVVVNTPGLVVGAVSLSTTNPAVQFAPTALVSAADSVLTGGFIILNAPAGAPFNGTSGSAAPPPGLLLGTFTGGSFTACAAGTCTASNGIFEDLDNLGPVAINPTGGDLQASFSVVPEPGSIVLLGLAAAGLALVRRKA